ncbi:MAG: DUF501 domain-containing protein [Bifidobacteriaceae bacterium]|nr:DUF501 domain-containing protein [Bifidobacteriaceae bacterium]
MTDSPAVLKPVVFEPAVAEPAVAEPANPGSANPGSGVAEPAVPLADRSRPRLTPSDAAMIETQLGRPARGTRAIAARCACGAPLVVKTHPRLADGTPFPTMYYLTHPGAAKAIGRLESEGLMAAMNQALAQDVTLGQAYEAAHRRYLAVRAELEEVSEIADISAGGMPGRVKCLHALTAQALAEGPGVNPFGDQALLAIAAQWRPDRCTCRTASDNQLEAQTGGGANEPNGGQAGGIRA